MHPLNTPHPNSIKKNFVQFIKRLIDENYTNKDWGEFIVNHYADENMEKIRRNIAKYFIENKTTQPFSDEVKHFLYKQLINLNQK